MESSHGMSIRTCEGPVKSFFFTNFSQYGDDLIYDPFKEEVKLGLGMCLKYLKYADHLTT